MRRNLILFAVLGLFPVLMVDARGIDIKAIDSLNCTLSGGWLRGNCDGVCIYDSLCYAGFGMALKTIDTANMNEISTYLLPDTLWGMRTQNTHLYVALNTTGLAVLDISNPVKPVLEGMYNAPEGVSFRDVRVVDTVCYVRDYNGRIFIINVANPASPAMIDTIKGFGSWCYGIDIVDTLLYVSFSDSGICVFNVKDPANWEFIGRYSYIPEALFVLDTILYTADNYWFRTYNVSDPSNIQALGSSYADGGTDLWVIEGYAFVISGDFLKSIDVSDPENPFYADGRSFAGDDWSPDIYYAENKVYIANNEGGMQVIDVEYPDMPLWDDEFRCSGNTKNLWKTDSLVYLIDESGGFRIINFSDFDHPCEIGKYYVKDIDAGDIKDTIAFLMQSMMVYDYDNWEYDYYTKLHVVNVSDPSSPVLVDSFDFWTGRLPSDHMIARDLVIKDTLAFTLIIYQDTVSNLFASELGVLNIKDPKNVTMVRSYPVDSFSRDIYIRGNFLAISDTAGLYLYDISDPLNIVLLDTVRYNGTGMSFIRDTLIYVAANYTGLSIVNMKDPSNLEIVGTFDTPGNAIGVYVQGNYAYVADGYYGVRVIDVSDPSSPSEVAHLDMDTRDYFGVVYDTLLYVCGGKPGLYVAHPDFLTGSIEVLKPQGYEVKYVGAQDTITWVWTGATNNVIVEYSLDRGIIWHTVDTTSNTGEYVWTVPDSLTDLCVVRIRSLELTFAEDETEPFIIKALTVVTPNGGDTLVSGSVYNIQWEGGQNLDYYVKLEVSYDNGNTWTSIVDSTENDNLYEWNVPTVTTDSALVRATLLKGDSVIGWDVSDGVFSIALTGAEGYQENPFVINTLTNRTINIHFSIPGSENFEIEISDPTGRVVRKRKVKVEGKHLEEFPVSSGIYFVRIKHGKEVVFKGRVLVFGDN